VAEAAKLLGWKRLPPLHHGEQTHWVCAAEPDEEKCKRVIVFEKVPISPLDMGEMDDDDLPEDGNYPVGVQYVREPLWWYDLNVMPYSAKDEVRSRLGADWVYTANKHDARRFFGDIAAHPSATLDWLDERTPSRRAVEKSLRNFVATLPVSHDYSARPTPRWIERLKGHHVENENEVKVGGKRYGWCFGGIHNATYMAMIDDDHELYFAMVRDRPVAIFIKRDTQGQTYDADLNQWSAASIYQDEYGPFALIEAKYPHNDEAIRDVKAVLRGMEYTPDYGGKTKKTIRRRRGNARRNPDRYSDDIEYYMAEAAVEDAAAVATRHIWEHGGRDSAKKSDRASRAMHETLFVADGAPDRLDALVKGVSMWVNTYLRTPEERSAFSRDLKNNIRRYRKAMRGVMALSKAEREKVGARELVRLVKRQMLEGGSFGKGSFPAAYGAFADQRRERTRESRRYHAKARMEQKGKRTRRKPRMARAAMALGYTRLPPLVFEEDAHWVCAAEPDEGKCRHVTTREHEKNQPTWQSPFEVKYVKEPLWWYNLDVIPEDSRAEVRSRLGADWVYLANKHDVRSFLPDLGANPTEVLAWMGERKPSRKMVEKNLRRYVRTLPVEHDFSDRSVPQWVRRLGGRHVENERDLKIVGRPNGWCFGSQFAGKYLSDLDRGYHLYFLNLNGELAAVWVNRTNLSTGTGDVFKDELGIFRLSEAKYPGNEEAYHDIVEVLRHDANVQELPDFQVEREFQETEGEIFMPDLTDIPDGDDDPNDLVLEL
jgi:hypothetical protein